MIRPIRGSNPKEIIQTILAKEITLEEYEQLVKKLDQTKKIQATLAS